MFTLWTDKRAYDLVDAINHDCYKIMIPGSQCNHFLFIGGLWVIFGWPKQNHYFRKDFYKS